MEICKTTHVDRFSNPLGIATNKEQTSHHRGRTVEEGRSDLDLKKCSSYEFKTDKLGSEKVNYSTKYFFFLFSFI